MLAIVEGLECAGYSGGVGGVLAIVEGLEVCWL